MNLADQPVALLLPAWQLRVMLVGAVHDPVLDASHFERFTVGVGAVAARKHGARMSRWANVARTWPRCGKGASWVALATHPHKEQVALDNLERQGFSVYCSKMRRIVRHARGSQEVLRPFFAGYMFARFGSAGSGWRSMASTFGVRRVITFGDRPYLLGEDFIVSLQAREVDGALMKPATPYKIGRSKCLTSGAFEGLVATIIEMDEKQRLVLLLDLLNQSVRVRTGYAGVREL